MLEKKYIINKLVSLNNLLKLCVIFSFISMISTKVFLYNNKKSANKLDFLISSLEEEEKTLDLELNLLTNPKRLEKLYSELHDKYLENSAVLDYRQIKDLNTLYPYFYSKKEVLLDKTLASK